MIKPDCDSIGVGVTGERQRDLYCYLFVGRPNTHKPPTNN